VKLGEDDEECREAVKMIMNYKMHCVLIINKYNKINMHCVLIINKIKHYLGVQSPVQSHP